MGVHHFYSETQNKYIGTYDSSAKMINSNTNGYVQINGAIERFSGSFGLSFNNQNYRQETNRYNKFIVLPNINLRCTLTEHWSLNYR